MVEPVQSLQGIVLTGMRYGDNKRIVKILTRERGLLSFIMRTERGRRRGSTSAFYQPFMLLDLVMKESSKSDLHTIREASTHQAIKTLHSDHAKSAQVMFLAELLAKTMHEEEQNEALFDYLYNAILWCDESLKTSCFHIAVMLGLTRFWGCYPQVSGGHHGFFDLREGLMQSHRPMHSDVLDGASAQWIERLSGMKFDAIAALDLRREIKNRIVHDLLRYYQIQVKDFKQVHSHLILQETFDV